MTDYNEHVRIGAIIGRFYHYDRPILSQDWCVWWGFVWASIRQILPPITLLRLSWFIVSNGHH